MSDIVTINAGDIATKDWISRRDLLLGQARAITVAGCEADVVGITAIQGNMGKHRAALKADRMVVTRQIDAVKTQVMDLEKELAADLDVEKSRLQKLASDFVTQQRQAAAEAERKRVDAEREAASAAMDHAEHATSMFGCGVDPALAIAPAAPVAQPMKVAGARVVTRWDCEVIDPNAVPHALMTFNKSAALKLIRAQAANGGTPQISGLRITSSQQVQSR